ncbi:trithorax group protein osa-like [Aplysia californica]|uniref:Trithorax group protein osa-like n=1 Tax=Aplysia californica TaxID=6500 RepID=A0ABM1VUM9_APLCA|nr:trithorax group protein osa-like [Aplysia californica]
MTWSPRNKPGEQDDDDDDDDNSKEKTENANNSDDDSENGKTNREEQHSTDRDPSRPSEITEPSTSATSMHAGRMYDPGPEPPHPPHSHLQGPAHSSDLSMPRRPQSFGNPHMASSGTPPSFLNMPAPSQVQGYSGPSSGAVTSQNGAMVPPHMEGPASGSLKRPDSLCSNSNDSGLSDVNCTYSEQTLDGLRPKIWSLAHVATSEPGYMNHAVTPSGNSSSSSSNSNVNNSLSRNLSSHPRGLIGGPMPTGGMGQGHMPPSMLAGSMGLTDNTHLSSVPPPPSSSTPSSMPPLSGHMSHQWGSIFGSHGLGGAPLGGAGGGAGGKSPCGPGPLFPPQSIPPGMGPGMPNGPPNTMATLHSSSPSPSAYNQNMSSPASYYPNQKMTMD